MGRTFEGPEGMGPEEGYECVEPALGDQLWRLDAPGQDEAHLKDLRLHLEICDHCRLVQHVGTIIAEELVSPGTPDRGRILPGAWRTALGAVSGMAVAASLALMFLLPPPDPARDHVLRADDSAPRFLEPVAGQVVLSDTPDLRWTPVPGASGYRITLQEKQGGGLVLGRHHRGSRSAGSADRRRSRERHPARHGRTHPGRSGGSGGNQCFFRTRRGEPGGALPDRCCALVHAFAGTGRSRGRGDGPWPGVWPQDLNPLLIRSIPCLIFSLPPRATGTTSRVSPILNPGSKRSRRVKKGIEYRQK